MMIKKELISKAYKVMYRVRRLSDKLDKHPEAIGFVHSLPTGHEAIQIAAGLLLKNSDYIFPYYRDTALLHAAGFNVRDMLMQLFSRKGDPYSGGTNYFNHVSYNGDELPKVPHQSSATGMQAIPAVSLAQGLNYRMKNNLILKTPYLSLCSLGEGALSSGEVSEAVQMAVFKKLPVVFLVQDNDWIISARKNETVSKISMRFYEKVKGLDYVHLSGWDFAECYSELKKAFEVCRKKSRPVMIHADLKLLGHHTSKVKKATYRESKELNEQYMNYDPLAVLRQFMITERINSSEIGALHEEIDDELNSVINEVVAMPADIMNLPAIYPPVEDGSEQGERTPVGQEVVCMAEASSSAIYELMEENPNAICMGQDIGSRLGGVFREFFGLASKFGEERVMNMSIQEAYIVGSCSGLSAAGCLPIVFVQFADYFMLGINQLFTEISKSYFLTDGKWPVRCLIRIPVGHYKGAGPYHAASIESILLNIKGVKVIYPSDAADMKGLLKSAFADPGPVISLEHKGLYWSSNPYSESAKAIMPDRGYSIPLGKGKVVIEADRDAISAGRTVVVITYGMGVHWSLEAARSFHGIVEIVDLRTLEPLDFDLIVERVQIHGKCLLVSEEPDTNSFSASLAGRIQEKLFTSLDAPVMIIGSEPVPAIPINPTLEDLVLVSPEKIRSRIESLLSF